jgi:Domain of unknown function (DUF5615)
MDVHVPRAVTTALRLRMIDVLTAQEDGAAQLDDDRLLQRASELGRILVSQDKDLLGEGTRRLKQDRSFSGIIYAHQLRVTIGQMVEDLELLARVNVSGRVAGKDRIFANPLMLIKIQTSTLGSRESAGPHSSRNGSVGSKRSFVGCNVCRLLWSGKNQPRCRYNIGSR